MTLRRLASVLPVLFALPLALVLGGCASLKAISVTPAAGVEVLTAIGHPDPAIRVAGMLHLLGQLQVQYGPEKLPALTQLFGRQAQVLIDRFHNRRTRERLNEELTSVLREGSLPRLLQFLDDAKERHADASLFNRARSNYKIAARAIERCEVERERIPDEAATTASIMAAGVSMVFGVLASVAAFLLYGHF